MRAWMSDRYDGAGFRHTGYEGRHELVLLTKKVVVYGSGASSQRLLLSEALADGLPEVRK